MHAATRIKAARAEMQKKKVMTDERHRDREYGCPRFSAMRLRVSMHMRCLVEERGREEESTCTYFVDKQN